MNMYVDNFTYSRILIVIVKIFNPGMYIITYLVWVLREAIQRCHVRNYY